MVYRNLLKKQIGLIGTDKICADLQEFFNELTYKQIVLSENITSEEVRRFEGCDVVLIGLENADVDTELFEDVSATIITLTDIFAMIDELESFYIDKMFGDRTVCVYGKRENISKMIESNPNMKIDYVISDEVQQPQTDLAVISINQIEQLTSVFVIIADEICENTKKMFTDIGMEFGKEFHFYNSRVPKNLTSYYLKKTLMDKPKYTIPCDYTKKALSIKAHGNVMACCSSVGLSMGNSLYTSIEEILRGIQAQLICLSINNRTYSFCGDMCFMFREKKYCLEDEDDIKNNPRCNISLREIKDFNVQLGYDRSCNLACPSCRDHRIIKPEDSKEIVEMIHDEVKRMCLKKPRNMRIGNGELFFSPYYKDIIFNQYVSDEIALISNGMLFTPENWSFLEKRYKKISLEVSIDAIHPDTYKKLRGGDLKKLHKNMEFASFLRRDGRLKKLSISFVIQVENYREMIGFVKYGKSINADFIHFMKLNSWGHIPEDKFIQMDVYDKRNKNHHEFVKILNNPLFLDPSVHVDNINNFLREEV